MKKESEFMIIEEMKSENIDEILDLYIEYYNNLKSQIGQRKQPRRELVKW